MLKSENLPGGMPPRHPEQHPCLLYVSNVKFTSLDLNLRIAKVWKLVTKIPGVTLAGCPNHKRLLNNFHYLLYTNTCTARHTAWNSCKQLEDLMRACFAIPVNEIKAIKFCVHKFRWQPVALGLDSISNTSL